jgi:anthranilate synthase component 1
VHLATGCVQRRLARGVNPLALYAAVERPDTGLFEGNDGRTLLMTGAAVRAECRGDEVRLFALSPQGESLLDILRGAPAGGLVVESAPDALTLTFPPPEALDAEARLRAPAPLHALRAATAAAAPAAEDAFGASILGVVSFDHAARGEAMADYEEDPLGFPDFVFWVPETLVLFEGAGPPRILCAAFPDADPARAARNHHDAIGRLTDLVQTCESALVSPRLQATVAEPAFDADLDDAAYEAVVARLKEEIAAGEVYQIVPSRTFRTPCSDPLAAYSRLRAVEPNSYRFFLRAADFTLFGASPETSVRAAGGIVEVKPIAGTRKRGASEDEDDRLEAELRLDHKELAEHMMLVDLARNDVARISAPGTRRVDKLLSVERYARLMHLVSSVTGRLAPGLDAFDALAACLNVGTLTGAPKIRAMQLLREAERTRRGPYGGAVGWVNGAGAMDMAVVIRSALVRDGIAYVRAGAGVVHDSVPAAEAEETKRKASALLSVLAVAEAEARP